MVTEHAETRFSEKQLCVLASQVRMELLEDQSHCESESFKLGETSDDIKASFAPSTIVPSTASLEDAQTTSPGGLLLGFLHWRELSCLITFSSQSTLMPLPQTHPPGCKAIPSTPNSCHVYVALGWGCPLHFWLLVSPCMSSRQVWTVEVVPLSP